MSYEFIQDLSPDLTVSQSEIESLVAAWTARRKELEGRSELDELNARLRRRWAIDTGMIEGLYSIERGTTELLIERGLQAELLSHGTTDQPASTVMSFLRDQSEVYDWIFDFVAQRRELSLSYIRELHSLFTRHQKSTEAMDQFGKRLLIPLKKGEWKDRPNNPRREDGTTHEYCPPEHVPSEMDRLIELHRRHDEIGVVPEIEAAWLHHRFAQIHPFQDGNGRVARAIASLVLIRGGRFAFSVSPDDKSQYIDALEEADVGDLRPLIDLIANAQRRELGQALSIAQTLKDEQQIYAAALAKASSRRAGREAMYEEVWPLCEKVCKDIADVLQSRRDEFNDRIARQGLDSDYHAHVFKPSEEDRHWYNNRILKMAEEHGYFADTGQYRNWFRLSIANDFDESAVVLVISIHSFGRTFKGVLSAVAFIELVQKGEEGHVRDGPISATTEPFTFGYLDPPEHVHSKLIEWLADAWLSALKIWQESL